MNRKFKRTLFFEIENKKSVFYCYFFDQIDELLLNIYFIKKTYWPHF